jgi:hypothetical protein
MEKTPWKEMIISIIVISVIGEILKSVLNLWILIALCVIAAFIVKANYPGEKESDRAYWGEVLLGTVMILFGVFVFASMLDSFLMSIGWSQPIPYPIR